MQIIKSNADRVMPHGLDPHDADMAPAGDNHLLPRPMPLHLGRGGFNAEIFRRQRESAVIVEGHVEGFFGRAIAQLGYGEDHAS